MNNLTLKNDFVKEVEKMMKGQVLYANFLRRGWEGTEKEEWLSLPITMRLDIMSHIPVLEWTPEDDGKLLAQTI